MAGANNANGAVARHPVTACVDTCNVLAACLADDEPPEMHATTARSRSTTPSQCRLEAWGSCWEPRNRCPSSECGPSVQTSCERDRRKRDGCPTTHAKHAKYESLPIPRLGRDGDAHDWEIVNATGGLDN